MKRILLIVLFIPVTLFSQTTFQHTYGTVANDGFNVMTRAHDGGYVVAGSSFGFASSFADAYIFKVDSLGTLLWNHAYTAPRADEVYCIRATSDGGYVVLLETNSFDANNIMESLLIKFDSAGHFTWAKSYYVFNGIDYNYPRDVIETKDHGFLIMGGTQAETIFAIKADSTGRMEWSKRYGSGDFISAAQLDNGDYFMLGYSRYYPGPQYRILLTRTDSAGNARWTKVYRSVANEMGLQIISVADSGIMIAGQTVNSGQGMNDLLLLSMDTSGVVRWGMTYGGIQNEFLSDACLVPGGGYYLYGSTLSFIFGSVWPDIYAIRTDPSGGLVWSQHYGTPNAEYAYSISPTPDDGCIMCGTVGFFGNGQGDAYLIKTNSIGQSHCHEDAAATVATPYTIADSLIAMPSIPGLNTYFKETFSDSSGVIMFSECFSTGIRVPTDMNTLANLEVYPCPAINEITVHTFNSTGTNPVLCIYDMLGNEMYRLADPGMKKNIASAVNIDISSFAEGVYFIRLSSNEFSLEKKFIKGNL